MPPSTVARFQERFGHYIHNAYGMTETSSAVTAVPPGTTAPVDLDSGTLSIGLPLPGVDVDVVDTDGNPVPPGSQGELVITGPQVISGYWRKPEEAEAALPEGNLRTGDSAIVDEQGWVYLVDRIKDQINVSGYKVWPREVEDVSYEHPAVLEAAVVGVPDEYQWRIRGRLCLPARWPHSRSQRTDLDRTEPHRAL
ncbi:class I adenylate-forming enzyme family protein [Nocardia cyriacigeorgica]|uniref:class I adenylate-forming enzyme family protein n=1 Tax=Nocardia cyriacigeorgica TaxID=135487 RepID=UPI0028064754|nr:AMP-binding protein [Nocardia cyriacigeorgica]